MADPVFTGIVNRFLFPILDWVEDRPPWLRSPLYGALFIYALMGVKGAFIVVPLLLAVTAFVDPLTAGRLFVAIVLLAPLGGLVGGVLYALVRPLGGLLGKTGRFLQSFIAGLGYGTVLVFLIAPVLEGKSLLSFSDPAQWLAVAAIGLVAGLAIGLPSGRGDST